MATFLDIGLVSHFDVIFPILFVFVAVFAFLEAKQPFGENKGVNSLVALTLAFMFAASGFATNVIENMAPWFVVMFVFIVFMLMAYKFMGATDANIADVLKGKPGISWAVFVVSIIILIAALASSFGEELLEREGVFNESKADYSGGDLDVRSNDDLAKSTATSSFETNLKNTLIHPKILGMILVFLIMMFTIVFMAGKS